MIKRTFIVNGVTRQVLVEENETLASFLRERLLLTGCKIGCGQGHCGACNVIVDGKVTRSCITKLSRLPDNAEIFALHAGFRRRTAGAVLSQQRHGGSSVVACRGNRHSHPGCFAADSHDRFCVSRYKHAVQGVCRRGA